MNPPAGLYFGRWDGKGLTFDYLNLEGESTSGYTSLRHLQKDVWPSVEHTEEFIIEKRYKLGCPKEYFYWTS